MGSLNGGSFHAIQEYFQQKSCRYCSKSFTSDGIQLIREEPGMLVVRVTCSCCGRPLGVAIVGTGVPGAKMRIERPLDWTKRDSDRFAGKPAITYDDVLSAHEFFDGLGADWARYLPVRGR